MEPNFSPTVLASPSARDPPCSQGWALNVLVRDFAPQGTHGEVSPLALSRLHGLSAATPPGQARAAHTPAHPYTRPTTTTTALPRTHGPGCARRSEAARRAAQFILFDMGRTGEGQWKQWQGAWGLPFVYTSLHTFGGNQVALLPPPTHHPPPTHPPPTSHLPPTSLPPASASRPPSSASRPPASASSQHLQGNLSEINALPFDAPPLAPPPAGADPATLAVGVGYTPEGLDQNPAYWELLQARGGW